MKAFNKIILGFIFSVSISAAEAQTTKSMFANVQPTRRIYNDNEIILPNYLQYEKIGPSENPLKSTIANNLVQISWQTKTETNTSHFELQRSKDGKNFEPIETITASGMSQKKHRYSTADASYGVCNDQLYYRVKSVFVNGKESFTAILTVDLSLTGQASANIYL
jgi:hypothetical protein